MLAIQAAAKAAKNAITDGVNYGIAKVRQNIKHYPTDQLIRARAKIGKPIEIKVSRDWEVRQSAARMRFQLNTLSKINAKARQTATQKEVHGEAAPAKDLFLYVRAGESDLVKTGLAKLNGKVGSLKLEINALMYKPDQGEYVYRLFSSHGLVDVSPNTSSMLNFLNTATAEVAKDIEEFTGEGSGAVFVNVESIYLSFLGYPTRSPAGGGGDFKLPTSMTQRVASSTSKAPPTSASSGVISARASTRMYFDR